MGQETVIVKLLDNYMLVDTWTIVVRGTKRPCRIESPRRIEAYAEELVNNSDQYVNSVQIVYTDKTYGYSVRTKNDGSLGLVGFPEVAS